LSHAAHEFENQFGGEQMIDGLEVMYGVWTGTPILYGIDRPKHEQEKLNVAAEMDALRQAAKRLIEDSDGSLSQRDALIIASSSIEREGDNPLSFNISDIKLSGLPEGMQTLVYGGQFPGTTPKQKKPRKGGGNK